MSWPRIPAPATGGSSTPDAAGGYLNGNWTKVKSARNAPLYFASAVLKNGQVIVAGGKQNNGQPADLCAAELYDPVSDTWTDLPVPDGWKAIGDAPCCVLPDGNLLLGSITDSGCALFNPQARTWTPTSGNKRNATSTGETWTLLPDGTVLSAVCNLHPSCQRYVDGKWIDESDTVPDLVEDASKEIGPAILLPDGRVFAIGATGATSLFTPNANRGQRGTWKKGPDFPPVNALNQGAKDAPACLLPNGRVLCCVGPVDGKPDTYDGPTTFFEYDPEPGTLTQLPGQPPNSTRPTRMARLLLLPNGSVLFSDGTTILRVYEPDGTPNRTGRRSSPVAARDRRRHDRTPEGHAVQWLVASLLVWRRCQHGNQLPDRAASRHRPPVVRYSTAAASTIRPWASPPARQCNRPRSWFRQTCPPVPISLRSSPTALPRLKSPISITAQNEQPGWLQTPEERGLQHELFWRDLNEVHLLMDFVSGRADKSLGDLDDVPDPDSPALLPGLDGCRPKCLRDPISTRG